MLYLREQCRPNAGVELVFYHDYNGTVGKPNLIIS